MKRVTATLMIVAMSLIGTFSGAQDTGNKGKTSRFIICLQGFREEFLALLPFSECSLVNLAELWAGDRTTLTDTGVVGKSIVDFVAEEERDGKIILWFTDDEISEFMDKYTRIPFGVFQKTGLKPGQQVTIYYQAQRAGDNFDISLAAIEVHLGGTAW